MKFFKKILPTLLMTTTMVVLLSLASIPETTFAQFSGLDAIGKGSGLPNATDFVTRGTYASSDQGISGIEALVLTVVDLVKYIIYGLAIFLAMLQGFKLVIAGKDIDTFTEEAKKNVKYSLMALIIVFIADNMIRKVFFPEAGALFENNGANFDLYGKEGMLQIRSLYNMMAYLSGSIALAVIIFSGVGMTLSAGSEDAMKKHTSRLTWALAGLLIIGIAEFVVKDVLFPDMGTKLPNISKGLLLVKKFTNFMSGFVTTISFVVMLYGGYLYTIGGVNEDSLGKAKKAIIAGIVGILMAASAFGLASTLIKTEDVGTTINPIGQAPVDLTQIGK